MARRDDIRPADLVRKASDLGFALNMEQAARLAAYLETLTSWNRRMNLVGPSSWQAIFSELVADSFHLAAYLAQIMDEMPQDFQTLDLGAGAGIPGIPLRILWNAGSYTLVEIREKRIVFLRYALSRLELPRTSVHGGRAEELLKEDRPAGLILSRAFMPWEKLLPFARPGLAHDGRLVVMARDVWTPDHDRALPKGWSMSGQTPYATPRGERYFWLFEPISA